MNSLLAAESQSAATYYISRVKAKIASGEYSTETVPCYCGSANSRIVIDKDRYGFDYPLHLCLDCALLYQSPRMTPQALKRFYAEEYRHIYDSKDETAEADFKNGLLQGATIQAFLDHMGIIPQRVYDIGCNAGGWLAPFQMSGARVGGVEYDNRRRSFGIANGIPIVSSISELHDKADLIILNHVLEHFSDLDTELSSIRELLTPKGVVYIGVPGLYHTTNRPKWQNAHNYEFTGETLKYVMECEGFKEVYLDEYISSVWRLSQTRRPRHIRSSHEVHNVENFFSGGRRLIPEIRTANKFPASERVTNIRTILARKKPDIGELVGKHKGTAAIIIGGGPSVDDELERIYQLIAGGCVVVAIERMYSWCLNHDITPDYVIALDASDDVIESFAQVSHETVHLVSTQCKPELLDRLENYSVYVFNTPQGNLDMQELWDESGYEACTTINAGGSVTIGAMSIAMTLGIDRLHIFGFDCHVGRGGYAKGITGVGCQSTFFEVEIEDEVFKTTPAYMSFAQQFFKLMEMARRLGMVSSIDVYGDSLINAMWDRKGSVWQM